MESKKLSMQVMQKVLTTSWIFITCPLIFYAENCIILCHISKYVLSFTVIFFNTVRSKPRIPEGLYTWIKSQCKRQDLI